MLYSNNLHCTLFVLLEFYILNGNNVHCKSHCYRLIYTLYIV